MDREGVQIDPFGYHPDRRSAVSPLGGDVPSLDQKYVFHTNYITCRAGQIIFDLRFENIRGSSGELCVQLQSYRAGDSVGVLLVNSTRRSLAQLTGEDLELSIDTYAVDGVSYALYGYVSESTDAEASSLTILLREMEDNSPRVPALFLEGGSACTDIALDRPTRLVNTSPASFTTPVSQALTHSQLSEDIYLQMASEQGLEPNAQSWPTLFAFRAIDVFGLTQPEARGLCLGDTSQLLGEILRRHGCVTLSAEAADPTEGFDFAWSIHEAISGDFRLEFAAFVEDGMRYILPKGVAVHLVPVASLKAEGPGTTLNTMDIQKAALTLIARGYDVAQLNFQGCDSLAPGETSPFGLIVQRPARRG